MAPGASALPSAVGGSSLRPLRVPWSLAARARGAPGHECLSCTGLVGALQGAGVSRDGASLALVLRANGCRM